MPHPLDEFPLHQVPRSMSGVGTSDRDFYDRSIFQVVAHELDLQLIGGFGVYPNLGVKDAYVCVRAGTSQHVVRCSDALDDDRMRMQVGPIRIEVVEPLHRVRLLCDGGPGELSCDLEWTPTVPVHDEPHHEMVRGTKLILDAHRFIGVGRWEGVIEAGGERWDVDHPRFTGTRDRSWGIRPVGGSAPAGRWEAEIEPSLHWFWVPLRFDDFALVVIIQEEPDGYRTLTDAVRLWPASAGRSPEQLGWPAIDVRYRAGTRLPESATIHLAERDRSRLTVEVEVLGSMPLDVGCGYGADPDWGHGQWRGRDWCERVTYDLTSPDIQQRLAFSVIDHAARVRCGDSVGYGIFEHATIGRHDPSGFADLFSVA